MGGIGNSDTRRHWAGTPGRGVPAGFVRNGTSTLKK
jgi:hypothetical protein